MRFQLINFRFNYSDTLEGHIHGTYSVRVSYMHSNESVMYNAVDKEIWTAKLFVTCKSGLQEVSSFIAVREHTSVLEMLY